MKIDFKLRSKKEIKNNALALVALGFVIFAGWLLYIAAAWILSWAFPSSVLEAAESGLKVVLYIAAFYWLFINAWLRVDFKRSK